MGDGDFRYVRETWDICEARGLGEGATPSRSTAPPPPPVDTVAATDRATD